MEEVASTTGLEGRIKGRVGMPLAVSWLHSQSEHPFQHPWNLTDQERVQSCSSTARRSGAGRRYLCPSGSTIGVEFGDGGVGVPVRCGDGDTGDGHGKCCCSEEQQGEDEAHAMMSGIARGEIGPRCAFLGQRWLQLQQLLQLLD